ELVQVAQEILEGDVLLKLLAERDAERKTIDVASIDTGIEPQWVLRRDKVVGACVRQGRKREDIRRLWHAAELDGILSQELRNGLELLANSGGRIELLTEDLLGKGRQPVIAFGSERRRSTHAYQCTRRHSQTCL